VKTLVFDGCALPFRDKGFDVIYSNAVIEHLADHDAQQRFAAEVVRVGRGWFVTTPKSALSSRAALPFAAGSISPAEMAR